MPVTFTDAAAALGYKSRSVLYRLRREGQLDAYLRPSGPTGRQLIEMQPEGLPDLREHVNRLVRLKGNSPAERLQPRPDPSWAVVAATLSDELGSLTLCAGEAQVIAGAIVEALLDGWGLEGVAWLAGEADRMVETLTPPSECVKPKDGEEAFRAQYGRLAGPDDPPLTDDEAEDHAALMVDALQGTTPARMRRFGLWDLERMIRDCRRDVRDGARFDQDQWDRGTVVTAIGDDLPDELHELLAAGRVPADLLEQVKGLVSEGREA